VEAEIPSSIGELKKQNEDTQMKIGALKEGMRPKFSFSCLTAHVLAEMEQKKNMQDHETNELTKGVVCCKRLGLEFHRTSGEHSHHLAYSTILAPIFCPRITNQSPTFTNQHGPRKRRPWW
jgi:hypothetical protein